MSNTSYIGRRMLHFFLYVICITVVATLGFAQEGKQTPALNQTQSERGAAQMQGQAPAEAGAVTAEPSAATGENLGVSQNVTMDFKEADIRNVLKIISSKSGMNIVPTPDVMGTVTIRLVEVPWERALDVLLKTYGYGYQKQGNVILVTKLENMSKIQAEEQLQIEIFNLKFLDAQDAEKVVIPLLSPRGKISVLYARGQKGWQFGTFKIGRESASSALTKEVEEKGMVKETVAIEKNAAGGASATQLEFSSSVKSKVLIITDTAAFLDKIRSFIAQIDKKPIQVLVEARIMEVNRDKLKDMGFDWGTGQTQTDANGNPVITTLPVDRTKGSISAQAGGHSLGSQFAPANFKPLVGTTLMPGTSPYNVGLEMLYQKITGTQFEVILHALEEDINTNTLSSPRVMTLDNQEASILVGIHTPILSSTVTAGTTTSGPTQTQTLDYYQEIGIRLNVVPQVSDEGYINMIVHPSVTSSSSNVRATNTAGTGADAITNYVDYPVIDVREAQTQVLMKDGETIVIGGLLKDIKSKGGLGIPFLSKIPLLGSLFKRDTVNNTKIDLLVFITAHIVKEGELTTEELASLEKNLGKESVVVNQGKQQKKHK